ncbi:MAG: lipid II:glycine glycyltransferase FemX [Chloroflexota bacterium]
MQTDESNKPMHVIHVTDHNTWNNTIRYLPYAHVLQTWEWGTFKQATTNWHPTRVLFSDGEDQPTWGAAAILERQIGPLSLLYVPKGPAIPYEKPVRVGAVLSYLETLARQRRSVWLKIDPDVILATGIPDDPDDSPNSVGSELTTMLRERGWRFSEDQVQFRNTITLDLTQSEDELLAQMSQNTRRKVRTAKKKGVTIRPAGPDDLDALYRLYAVTGMRDEFLIRPRSYYEKAWRDFLQAGLAHALIAEYEDQPIAHVILFHFGSKCWYFYGASNNTERQRMPNYLLQWEAMRWAKNQGYRTYDMWGAPNTFDEDDTMWGVFQFKRGFRGTVTRHIGAWDYVSNPLLYRAYAQVWPQIRRFRHRVRGSATDS